MKKISLFFLMLFGACYSNAQTTATDFTVNDCDGNSHHLFSELESGRIIVLAWVMPCGGCIFPARSAYNVAQSYSIDYPGRVFFYMADDYANSSCSSIQSWATSNNMPNCTFFSNSAISMGDYGTDGMPKVVVLAGGDHKIYYNMNDFSDAQGVEAAIDSALAENPTFIAEHVINTISAEIYPNPSVSGKLNFSISLKTDETVTISFFDAMGRLTLSDSFRMNRGLNENVIDAAHLPSGIYYVNISAGANFYSQKIVLGF